MQRIPVYASVSACLPKISRRTPEGRPPRETGTGAVAGEQDQAMLLMLVEMVHRVTEPLLRVHALEGRKRVVHPAFPFLLLQRAQQQFLVCGGTVELLDWHAGERERAQLGV